MPTGSPYSGQRIPFVCPHCGHHTEVDVRFAGQSGPCVGCSNIITVPTIESAHATPAASHATADPKPVWIKVGMSIGAVLCLAVLGIVVWSLLQPAYRAAQQAAKCAECEANLLAIGGALEAYYSAKGEYPRAVVYDENGKAMHSWRVLILPYLGPEARQVYDQYKMDEPWDSKSNSMLIRMMPDVYLCPADTKAIPGETSYLAVVGDETLLNAVKPVKRTGEDDGPVLRDNPAETMVILESGGSGVNWMEPKDIPMAALRGGLNSSNPRSPGSQHDQGVNILMADQSIIRLEDTVSSDDLRGMATINGQNEFIEVLDELEY